MCQESSGMCPTVQSWRWSSNSVVRVAVRHSHVASTRVVFGFEIMIKSCQHGANKSVHLNALK